MAYFFLTNNSHLYKVTKDTLNQTEFKISFEYLNDDNFYAIATHKLLFNNINYAQQGNDFCIAIGTCIYNESLDYSHLLENFNGDIANTREDTLGQYAICIKKENNLIIYGDACGCFNIYYWQGNNGDWIITTSQYHLAKVLKDKITLDNFSIAERSFYRVLLNGRTFFNEINRLRGTEYLSINIESNTFELKHIEVDFPVGKFDDMVDKVVQSYRNNAKVVANALGIPKICATGGLDSRILLAAFLSVGVKPILFYGYGNNIITAPKNEDIVILKKMSKNLGLEIEAGDFSISEPPEKDWDRYITTNGFRAAYMWGAQRNVINSLCNGQKLLMFGWGGEYLRRSWYHLYNTPSPSIDVLLAKWHEMQKFDGLRKDIPNYETIVREHFVNECQYLGINPDHLTEDDIYLLEIAWGAQADTQIPSFMQQYKYCYLMSFEYNIQKFRVTATERDYAKFMLAVMHKLYPALLKEPIFTHEQWVSLDEKTMTLVPYQSTFDKINSAHTVVSARRFFPPIIKLVLFRPIKRMISSILKKEPIITIRPSFDVSQTEVLKDKKNTVNINNIYDDHDKSQYAILVHALKKLGY